MIPVMKYQIHRDRKYKLAGAEWKGNGKLLYNVYRDLVWDNEKVLEMDSSDGCTTMNVLNATKLYS